MEDIKFYKEDATPWGFRLTGGADFEVPLHVVKVTKDSIADQAGMQLGDLIVKINDKEAAELTHIQAHDVILNAGYDFTVTVVRGDELQELQETQLQETIETALQNHQICLESMETETTKEEHQISGKLTTEVEINVQVQEEEHTSAEEQQVVQNQTKVITSQVENEEKVVSSHMDMGQIINSKKVKMESEQMNTRMEEKVSEAVTDEIKTVVGSMGIDLQSLLLNAEISKGSEVLKVISEEELEKIKEKKVKEKKWSTFLQKPSRPKPKDKKREQQKPKVTKQQLEREVEEVVKDVVENMQQEEEEIERSQTEQETEEIRKPDDVIEPKDGDLTESVPQVSKKSKAKAKLTKKQSLVSEVEISLEEQLAAVQRQLLALSQLPQAIQQILDVVTSELAKIVGTGERRDTQDDIQNKDGEDNTEENDYQEDDYEQGLEILDEIPEESELQGKEHETEDFGGIEAEEEKDGRQGKVEEGMPAPEPEKTPEPEFTEEEKEVKRIEQEKLDKKQKDHLILEELHQRRLKERPSFPLTPLERSIFLPGGRRWRMPGDAAPETSCPADMSDDIIAETISSQSEIITGTTLGINFLKFEPLPVNLEHLKRSQVYRLVHDLEPTSARGIAASRTDKPVPAADDYHNQIRKESIQQDDALVK